LSPKIQGSKSSSYGGIKCEYPFKVQNAQNSCSETQTCCLASTADKFSEVTNIDDLERPWNPNQRIISIFSQFWVVLWLIFQQWIASKLLESGD